VGIFDGLKLPRLGRRRLAPVRDTIQYPNLIQIGRVNQTEGLVYKPSPRNLRYFSRTPWARRAINAIKDPIKMMEWEIVPIGDVDWNSELKRQAKIVANCFEHPNETDDWASMLERFIEDYLCGCGALETQVGGDPQRPLWIWPTDGFSIQIYPNWDGNPKKPHYAQTVGYGSQLGGGQFKVLFDEEMLYLAPNQNTATPFGFGPLEMAFQSVASQISTGKFAAKVAGNQRSSVLMDFPGYPAGELEAIRHWWRNDIEGQGMVPIISSKSGADGKPEKVAVQRLYPEGDKALFLEYQEFLIRELAAAFGLSPQNFGLERDVNRNTAEVSEDRDWDQAIKPAAIEIARALTRHCIQKRLGFSQLMIRFVGLDREDELATMQILEKRYQTNSITPNEIRDRFGEVPMDDSPWADLTNADVQVAMDAARGAKEVIDPRLPTMIEPQPPQPPAGPKKGPKKVSAAEAGIDGAISAMYESIARPSKRTFFSRSRTLKSGK